MASKSLTIKSDFKLPTKSEIKTNTDDVKGAVAAFQKGAIRASKAVETALVPALNDAIDAPVWGPFSPKTPYISRGGNPKGTGLRSLFDTGELKSSLSIKTSFLQSKTVTTIKYNTPYANLVHFGGAIQPWGNPYAATVILPARPWVYSVLADGGPVDSYDWQQVYEHEIDEAWANL